MEKQGNLGDDDLGCVLLCGRQLPQFKLHPLVFMALAPVGLGFFRGRVVAMFLCILVLLATAGEMATPIVVGVSQVLQGEYHMAVIAMASATIVI